MASTDFPWIWVEAFARGDFIDRWRIDGLAYSDVLRCLGHVPEGLVEVNESLLGHVARTCDIVIDPSRHDEVLLGREHR